MLPDRVAELHSGSSVCWQKSQELQLPLIQCDINFG
jgi:hypothetical protein